MTGRQRKMNSKFCHTINQKPAKMEPLKIGTSPAAMTLKQLNKTENRSTTLYSLVHLTHHS